MSRRPARFRRGGRLLLGALLIAASVGWIGDGTSVAAAPAQLISVDPKTSGPFTIDASAPSVSGDGNVVVFNTSSFSASLGIILYTVYVRNRVTGTTETIPGLPPEFTTFPGTANGVISRDGCHVVFFGRFYFDFAAGRWNIYSWNRCAANSAAVEIADGVAAASDPPGSLAVSADGRYVAYTATRAGVAPHIARIDTSTLTEDVLTTPFRSTNSIDISDDGKFVAIGGQRLVGRIVSDQVLGWTPPCGPTCTIEVISVGNSGQTATGFSHEPSVSADGRYVAFTSNAADIIGFPAQTQPQVYVRDRVAGFTRLVTSTPGQPMPAGLGLGEPDISPDGSQIALTQEDSGETSEVWVARSSSGYFNTAVFDLVSFGVSGAPVSGTGASSPSMSSTGRLVAFASRANTELSGGTVPATFYQVWMRDRPVQLDITPTLNFGTVDLGTQSPPQNAVVTNTSGVEINIGSVSSPAAPFAITGNSCGGVLPSGATCVVTVVFSPTAVGGASSSVTVSGDGVSVSVSLIGTGRGSGVLSIKPATASYGTAVVGTSLPAKNFVVSNVGLSSVALAGVTLGGSGADQFAIASNGCAGTLAPGASCTIQVSATVTRAGSLTATLDVLGAGGLSAHATLRIGGEFTPTLKMNPGVVSGGEITAAIGSGFPPNIDVQLAFAGEAPFATVHTDGGGAFRFDYLLLRHGVRIGGRQVVAVDQAEFSGVHAPLLIELAASQPTGFESPAITSGVRSLVNRGG